MGEFVNNTMIFSDFIEEVSNYQNDNKDERLQFFLAIYNKLALKYNVYVDILKN